MTTIGKILVFLVFIAALAMGGLMVFVSKTSPNWKAAVDERDNAVIPAYKAMINQEAESRAKLLRDLESNKKLLEGKIAEAKTAQEQFEVEKKKLQEQIATASQLQEASQLSSAKAVAQADQLRKELEFNQGILKEREKTINKLTDDVAQARTAEQAAKNDAVTAANRLQNLYEQLKEKERVLAEASKKNQPTSSSPTGVKDATYTNPPSVYVKGKIDSVDDRDKTRVQISIGSDSGIRKDQTLEVFRTSPRPEYLGRLVIVDVNMHESIGRLLRQPGVPAASLQPGDQVATSIRQ